jgi:hypothetical protein
MFKFFRKPRSHQPPTKLIAQAMAKGGLAPDIDPATLSVAEQSGSYSGREVTYFRVYDRLQAAERSLNVREYTDLDDHSELILASGHIEKNGALALSGRERPPASTVAFTRSKAVQGDHPDDDQIMFPERAPD